MKNGIMTMDDYGRKYWFLNGLYHRTDGPAIEGENCYEQWFINGKRHRLDGPAIERKDGSKSWCIDGKYYGEGDEPPVDYILAALIFEGMPE